MSTTLLGEVLEHWDEYELDDSIYLPAGAEISLDLKVSIFPFEPVIPRLFEDQEYMLGIEQVRDAVEGLEAQLGRVATPIERLRAVVHYAQHDAFIDPSEAIGKKEDERAAKPRG